MNQSSKLILAIVLFIGVAALATSYYVEEREREIIEKITAEVEEQEAALATVAELTDRNGADAVVESIIRDCSIENRQRFDSLLDRLGTLGQAELSETQSLFDACARFYASRKALMVARMEREFEFYRDMVDMLEIIDDSISIERYEVSGWQRLVELEQRRSDIFSRQVEVQQEIITALQEGEPIASENIQSFVSEAQDINEEAFVLDQQIDKARQNLVAP